MAADDTGDQGEGLYERRIGTPTTADEVSGYWLFGFGILLGLAGVVVFAVTDSATPTRGIGYALAALAPPFIMLGAVIRFPLRRAGTFFGYLGTTVSVLGVVWFVSIFPDGWFTASGDPVVIALYGVGLLLIGLAGTVVPLLSDPVYEDYERMQTETATATAERDETSSELEETREKLAAAEDDLAAAEDEVAAATAERDEMSAEHETAREELAATEDELAAVKADLNEVEDRLAAATAEGDETNSELEAAREELSAVEDDLAAAREALSSTEDELAATEADLATAEERATELDAAAETARATAASLRESKARFELFDDAKGKPRWRLRHRNGNVIATSGQGYSSRGKAQQGLHSVRRNALGAGLLRIETPAAEAESVADDGPEPDDAEEPAVALPAVVADEANEADEASDATFELFEDEAAEWRWRLRHRNGNVVSNSGEGYASKSNVKRALGRVREQVAAADYLRVDPAAFEMFRDTAGEWRWRLIHENGNILADSGQGYTSRSKARQGLDSVRSNAAEAALDDLDDESADDESTAAGDTNATFELYEDKGGDYRWRLRHRNGNLVADCGEGYASKSNAMDAIERARNYASDADVLDVGNAAFEIYEDAADEWRWRLRHRNGNIVAASGKGYASRSNATEAVTRVKETAPGADEETAA